MERVRRTIDLQNEMEGEKTASVSSDEAAGVVSRRKQHKRLVRLLTVAAYVLSVSAGALLLSLYYIFLWDPNTARRDTTLSAATQRRVLLASHPTPNDEQILGEDFQTVHHLV